MKMIQWTRANAGVIGSHVGAGGEEKCVMLRGRKIAVGWQRERNMIEGDAKRGQRELEI